jgi:hypothetical protein
MDFIDKLQALAASARRQKAHINTEEATKTALVMPFLSALGYDVFDPTEVVPEFTADVGTKKGEKVDYAIVVAGQPAILVECKWCGTDLDSENPTQLFRYFSVTRARFAILTNGLQYRFYTDLEEPNKLDQKAFLDFNLLDIKDPAVDELRKFSKQSFDVDQILATASDLKYTKEVKRILAEQVASPGEQFTRFFASQVYPGRLTQPVLCQFTEIVKRGLGQFLSDRVSDRLKSALAEETLVAQGTRTEPEGAPAEPESECSASRIETTAEELEAYYIVKAVLREVVNPKRIVLRDAVSYCSVILDDTNRRPVCRFRFTDTKKELVLVNTDRSEDRVPIAGLDDIYSYADRIRSAADMYPTRSS